jgi:hypothetical protein
MFIHVAVTIADDPGSRSLRFRRWVDTRRQATAGGNVLARRQAHLMPAARMIGLAEHVTEAPPAGEDGNLFYAERHLF